MLLELRDYIRREKIVSSQQLLRIFEIQLTALQPMLDIWLKKGVIVRCDRPSIGCQKACIKCQDGRPIYYEYYTS